MIRTNPKKKAKRKLLDQSLVSAWGGAVAYLCLTAGTAFAEDASDPAAAVKTNATPRVTATSGDGSSTSGKNTAAKAKAKSRRAKTPTPATTPQTAAQATQEEDGFAAYDWDGDGSITREEWSRGPKPKATAAAGVPGAAAATGLATPDYAAQERAAELAESNPKQLGDVTVTAQKRKESAQRVPTAITVLSGQRIIDQGIGRSASEVLNYVPNASAGTQFNGRPRWWIRGVGTGQQQLDLTNPIGFYQDQVYISNSTSTGFPLFDLQRVEVLRGPQGTLWGKNTTGGAIDLVSRKPSLSDNQEGYIKLGYGTFNDDIVEGAYGHRLTDTIAARAAFHYEHRDGRFNTQDPVTHMLNGNTQGGLDDAMFRVSFLDQITPDLEALFNVHYRNYDTQGGVTTLNLGAANPVTGVLFKDPLTGYTVIPKQDPNVISTARRVVLTNNQVSQKGSVLTLTQKLNGYTATGITGYEDWSSATYGSSAQSPQSSWQVSQEFRLASPREDRWNWITGLHYFYEKILSDTTTSTLPCGVGLTTTQIAALPNGNGCLSGTAGQQAYSNANYNHSDESIALFTSHTFNITDEFLTTAGLRYTHETKNVTLNRQQAVAPANGTLNYNDAGNSGGVQGNGAVSSNPLFFDATNWWQSVNPAYLPKQVVLTPNTVNSNGTATNFVGNKSVNWDMITYDITPQYRFNDTDMAFFKQARGMKSGGFNTSASTLAALNAIIKPETLISYELGLKTGWFKGRLKANATLFYYDYKNDQLNITAVPNPQVPTTPTGYIYNVSAAHSQGAEFELEGLPHPDLHLIGNIGLLDTRFDNVSNINQTGVPLANQILVGNEMVRSPHFTSFLQADYKIPYTLPFDTHLLASMDWRYTSSQYYYVNFQDQGHTDRGLMQGGYSILNSRITVASNDEKYSLTGYINNALDTVYLNHSGTGTPANFNTGTQIYGMPRTFGLQLNARFW